MTTHDIIPFEATHPGTVLADELSARNIRQKDLASELNVLPTFLNEIIKGKRAISADIAILLEKALGIPADYWMRFQIQYDIDKAKLKEKNIRKIELIETWNIIKEYVPLKYFKKLGYFSDSLESNIDTIKEIYKVNTIDSLVNTVAEHQSNFYYRKSGKLDIDKMNMLAWSKITEYEADKLIVKVFDASKFSELKRALHLIFYNNQDVKLKTKQKLADYGIKLIYLQKFEKTPVDGSSFWSIDKPAIALTLRHKRIDNFAFTIMHELAHIDIHLQSRKDKRYVDISGSKRDNLEERQADDYAKKALIPQDKWDTLIQSQQALNDEQIISFAKQHGIHPAIILGRACFEMNYYAVKSEIDRSLN